MRRDVSHTFPTTTAPKEGARVHICTLSASTCPQTRQSPPTFSMHHCSFPVDLAHKWYLSRAFSVYLHLSLSPEDLMIKFVDCLVRLSNLRTLEILGAGPRVPISKALRRKYATFPSIRELRIAPACHHFIKNCPNLESLTFTRALDTHAPATVLSHGKGLKRIAGVPVHRWRGMHGKSLDRYSSLGNYLEEERITAVGSGCPNLREIGIIGGIRVSTPLGGCLRCVCLFPHHSRTEITLKHCGS